MIVAFVAISVSSCKKSFLKEELNNDPSSLANADPKVLLPTAISNMAYFYGGDFARIDAMLTQQTTGAGNQWFAMQNYDFVNSDFDNCWNSTYVTTLNSLKKMGDIFQSPYKLCKDKLHYFVREGNVNTHFELRYETYLVSFFSIENFKLLFLVQ
jgi:hypothetical protein